MLKKLSSTPTGPCLIIAPLSLIVNWQREITTWTDLDAILYYGSPEDRELIRAYEFTFLDHLPSNGSKKRRSKKQQRTGYKVEIIITTPETCVAYDNITTASANINGNNLMARYRRELSHIHWDLIIVDEAHKLKNYESKLGVTLREEYIYKNVILLTGTPLQNNTDELWTLLNFVDRKVFDDRDAFYHDYGELKTSNQLESLHHVIKPYLLRREKDLVEKTVPPKEEIIIEVELTVPQKQYYRAIYEQKTQFLYKQGSKDGPSLSNLAMELRKCCNHPFLIKGASQELSKHFSEDSPADVLIKSSGKMTLLHKLLPKLYQDQHRVLIFSQFRIMLDIIEDYLHHTGHVYERIDGSVTGKKRQAAIDRFSSNSNVFVMLLSTRAGGVGINLTAADTVIIFDR
jgi:SNF2 family DNA or RNA helicase